MTAEAWSAIAAFFSAITGAITGTITGAALFTAREAKVASVKAAEAADTMARIERRRERAEMTPRFDITCKEKHGLYELRVRLIGPDSLRPLKIKISVRDDRSGRTPHTEGGLTQEDIDAQIWGPLRFRPGADGADKTGRRLPEIELLPDDERSFCMETTPRLEALSASAFREEIWKGPLRLELVCEYEDYQWIVNETISLDI